MKSNLILIIIFSAILLITILTIVKNPNCPFHVDYIQYVKSINTVYDSKIIDDNVNGKYFYVYIMSILLVPFKLLSYNLYDGMVIITTIFLIVVTWLFYQYTKSLLKTILMATSLTFLTLIGHAETAIIAAVPLLLFFIFRDKPWAGVFIALAALIRLDAAVFYLFARNPWTIIPIAFTGLQWLQGKFFLHSDLGINPFPLDAFLVFFISFGFFSPLLLYFGRFKKHKYDWFILTFILIFFIFFLKFPTQKLFLFPVILTFMFIDFDFSKIWKHKKPLLTIVIALNLILGGYTTINRINTCTPTNFHTFALEHEENIEFGIFQPYLDYHGLGTQEPYSHGISIDCANTTDYFIAEDWRNSQLRYSPIKFCLEPI